MTIPRKLRIVFLLLSMIYHHTKNKGDLGVMKVKVDLYEQGFLILVPETEHSPFDLVIYKNGKFKTVQVKFRNLTKNGVLEIPFRSCYSTSKGVKTKSINKSLIDLYAVYCPQSNECYYFNPLHFNKSITLRVKTSLNNQKLKIHLASDYRKVP
jgi:PD-(D/E)XK endonuclease